MVIFTENAITRLFYVHFCSIAMGLIYTLINLRPSTYVMGSNVKVRQFGVNGKTVILTINAILS